MTGALLRAQSEAIVRILHLEDSAVDAELVCAYLDQAGVACEMERVWTREEFTQKLSAAEYDIILADHRLPAFDGEAALEIAREHAPQTPFVFVSGTLGEEVAVAAMKRGATDYVVKQRLDRLPDVVARALAESNERAERRRVEAKLSFSEDRYRALFNAIPQGFCVIRLEYDRDEQPVDFVFEELNDAFETQTGIRGALGRSIRSIRPDQAQNWIGIYGEVVRTGVPRQFENAANGLGRHYSIYAFRIGEAADRRVAVLFENIGERVEKERQLLESDTLYRFLDRLGSATRALSDADDVLAETTRLVGEHLSLSNCAYADMDEDEDGFTIRGDWSAPGSPSIQGHYSLADFGELAVTELHAGRPLIINDNLAELAPNEAKTFLDIGIAATICMPLLKAGKLVALMAIHDRLPHAWTEQELVTIREVAERSWTQIQRVRSDAALRELNATLEQRIEERTRQLGAAEEALRQSQKMEAIGQLTGGLAHDFNNLLTAVTGGLDLLETRLKQGRYDQLDRYLDMARTGTSRAAGLVQRLLAFARRQTLDPTPTNADRLVAGMRDLIDRTLGPSIEVAICMTEGLWATMIDAPQLESALLNLCINARDAMPNGGQLTISTENVVLGATSAAQQDLAAGDYVALSVTDTGTGMTPEVIERVFDPFFTTKPLGQGTGLGLSMVYGFLRQSGGQVRVDSELGQGTTVCLYLPRMEGEARSGGLAPPEAARAPEGGAETILLVEDEEPIRELVSEALGALGYQVLKAADGRAGLDLLRRHKRVDLLITDVGLPGGLNGRQVADAGRSIQRALKTLFITGYAANAAVGAGHLEAGMAILTKPFNIDDLVRRVRSMLDDSER